MSSLNGGVWWNWNTRGFSVGQAIRVPYLERCWFDSNHSTIQRIRSENHPLVDGMKVKLTKSQTSYWIKARRLQKEIHSAQILVPTCPSAVETIARFLEEKISELDALDNGSIKRENPLID